MQKITPTLFQIISTDYLAQNFFVMIFGVWVIYAVDTLIESHSTFFLLVLAAVCTPIGLLLFYWRHQTILSTFKYGIEITGQIVAVQEVGSRSGKKSKDYVIDYEYDFKGNTYQNRNRVKKNDTAHALRKGQTVALVVNEKNPKTAFIRDMYLVYI